MQKILQNKISQSKYYDAINEWQSEVVKLANNTNNKEVRQAYQKSLDIMSQLLNKERYDMFLYE